MPQPTNARIRQLLETYRIIGADHVTLTYDYREGARTNVLDVGWADHSDRPPIRIRMTGHDVLQLYILCGLELSRRLAEERPDVKVPDVVWT
jgi:hypothetical protein